MEAALERSRTKQARSVVSESSARRSAVPGNLSNPGKTDSLAQRDPAAAILVTEPGEKQARPGCLSGWQAGWLVLGGDGEAGKEPTRQVGRE